ncbi:putative peptidyl-tRNA hydrolase PTRHD1 [Haemaphysalis longicornis]
MAAPTAKGSGVLVQYLVVRSDLLTELGWPIGAVIAQACHAATAVMQLFKDDPNTIAYTDDLDNMHKVVLAAPTDAKLIALSKTLEAAKVDHKLWTEQPENIPTCLATKPYAKSEVQPFFKDFKLFK